ncbi:MAG: amino acid adenylation domain-containing protein [Deltaproteobacteria bacterium]|nr:amino acid adenylation domain-containing protein [Deltaproteobacteria bacterium]
MTRELPLTDLQEAYWVGSSGNLELACSPHRYFEVDCQGLDLERLRTVMHRVFQHVEVLRARLTPEGRWRIGDEHPGQPGALTLVDHRGSSEAEAEAALACARAELSVAGPSPAAWPLEVRAHQMPGGGTRLLLAGSLMALDAGGWRALSALLGAAWRDEELPSTPSLARYLDALAARAASPAHERSLAAWRERLPFLAPPELPLAAGLKAEGRRWHHLGFTLEGEVRQALASHAARAGLTLPTVLLTAYADVVGAWSRSPSFTLTSLLDNRPLEPGCTGLIGNASSTLLVEIDGSGADFVERARQHMAAYLRAMRHRSVNGVLLARELNRYANGQPPSFPVVFHSVLPREPSTQTLGFLGDTVFDIIQTPQVWLDGQAYQAGDELVVRVDARAMFADGVVEDMTAAIEGLLRRLAERADAWSGRACLTPRAHLEERAQDNATAAPLTDDTLHGLFEAQAERTPDALAVVDGGGTTLTYGALRARVEALAAVLISRGLVPDRLVAVVMDKGIEQVIATLAVLRCGCAYVPLTSRSTPRERLWHVLKEIDASLALTQRHVDATTPWPDGVQRICVDDLVSTPVGPPPARVDDAGRRAYVIYTSGSTGTPKGVVIDHRGAVNTIHDLNRRFCVTASDRVFAISSLAFDLSVYDLFGTLAAGGAIVMPRAADALEPAAWAAQMARDGVTVWNSAPQLLELLVHHGEGRLAPTLRLALLSGDWIPVSLPDRLRRLIPGVEVVSLGGATEASIWSIVFPIGAVPSSWTSIPYGKPLANQRFEVLDEHLLPRPKRVAGDLYIGGAGLALGYWRDDDKTARSFITRTVDGRSERLYRTGDRGRYVDDGNIEFLGRVDQQVKVGGHRIELGEIEAALVAVAGVREAHVRARSTTGGPQLDELVAWIVGDPGFSLDAAALAQALHQRLPGSMVPSRFVPLERLPLSANGKVDLRALPEPAATPASTVSEPEPADDLEQRLAALWASVLGLAHVSSGDDFFALGGTSLKALVMMGRLRATVGAAVPVRALFEHRTVRALAAVVRDKRVVAADSLVPVGPAGPAERPPLFIVHAVGGGALSYLPLGQHLADRCELWGIESPALHHPAFSPASLEELATRYLELLQRVPRQGPWRLCGWSLGGVVAFEMARQLLHQGEEVMFLGLIDSHAPGAPKDAERELDEETLLSWLAIDEAGMFDDAHALDDEQRAGRSRAFRLHVQLLQRYHPDGRLPRASLFRAAEQLPALVQHPALRRPRLDDHQLGWERLVHTLDVHELAGTHFSIVAEPHVRALAQAIARAL